MDTIALKVENLSKRYRIGVKEEMKETLIEAAVSWIKSPVSSFARVRKLSKFDENESGEDIIWALKDVCFEVKHGEVLGIIGRNGAGKSTLLKIISRITRPSFGRVVINGRVSSLLEVGTGFHPELTGRENVYLNGTVLGMSKQEIDRKYDEIVAFAEIEKFMETAVKRYSSGMRVRLAFAVAAHLEPEILLVDEVLAVGDAGFQRKCLGKMENVAREGRTVLFVSHNMAAVKQLCTQGLMLVNGQTELRGPVGEVVDKYLMAAMEDCTADMYFAGNEESAANIDRISLRNEKLEKASRFSNLDPIILEIEFTVRRALSEDHIFVLLSRVDGFLVMKASEDDGTRRAPRIRTPGKYVTRIRWPGGILNEGLYQFRVVIGKRRGIHHDIKGGSLFEIEDLTDYTGSFFGKRDGALLFPLAWEETKLESF